MHSTVNEDVLGKGEKKQQITDDDFIPSFYLLIYNTIMFPERQKRFWDVVLFSFHPWERGTKRKRKQGPELLSRENTDVVFPAATRDVFHPSSPTLGSVSRP